MQHQVYAIFASICGAVAYVVLSDIKRPIRGLLYILVGATTAIFTGPALAGYLRVTNEKTEIGFQFVAGLLGVVATRALTRWADRNSDSIIGGLASRFTPGRVIDDAPAAAAPDGKPPEKAPEKENR